LKKIENNPIQNEIIENIDEDFSQIAKTTKIETEITIVFIKKKQGE
jgi:hypothetical protein